MISQRFGGAKVEKWGRILGNGRGHLQIIRGHAMRERQTLGAWIVLLNDPWKDTLKHRIFARKCIIESTQDGINEEEKTLAAYLLHYMICTPYTLFDILAKSENNENVDKVTPETSRARNRWKGLSKHICSPWKDIARLWEGPWQRRLAFVEDLKQLDLE